MKQLKTALTAVASVAALQAGHAFAQTSASASTVPQDTVADEPQTSGDILVTARRSTERLNDIPLAIQAQTSEQLASRNIIDLQGLARYTPGLQFKDFVTAFNGSATLRGLTQTNVQNAVGNVGTFIDGVYLQRGYLVNTSIGDWERIEVVKGPQSALYGANTFSGAINYVVREPTNVFAANASATVGTHNGRQFSGAVGGPIIEDVLSVRIFAGQQKSDGTWKNMRPGAAGLTEYFGAFERTAFSGAIKFTPIAALKIGAYYSETDRIEYLRPYYAVDGTFVEDKTNCGPVNAVTGRPSLFCGTFPVDPAGLRSGVGNRPANPFAAEEAPTILKTRLFKGSLDYDIGDSFALHYLFGRVTGQAQEDLSFFSNTFNPTGRPVITAQHEGGKISYTSHEVRVAYDGDGPFKADVGYFRSRVRDQFNFGIRFVSPGASIPRLSDDPLNLTGIIPFTSTDARYSTDSVFVRASFAFFDDRAKISAEARYSDDRISFNDLLARGTNPALPLLESAYKSFVPRVTAEYNITTDMMLYASAAKGQKAGGFNGYVSNNIPLTLSEQSFGPESNWTYELGSKNTLFDSMLTINLSAFYIDWSNKQAAVVPSGFNINNITLGAQPPAIFQTSASARSIGVEVEGEFRPMQQLKLTFAGNYTKATYGKGAKAINYVGICDNIICPANGDISGRFIEGAPSLSFAGGVEWADNLSADWKYFVGLDGTYQNRQYVDAPNLVKIAGFALFDGRVGVESDHWKIFAWGKNMFDHKYVQAAFIIPSLRQYSPTYGDRATYGLTVSLDF